MMFCQALFMAAILCGAEDNRVVNGDFREGLQGWSEVWSRNGTAKAEIDSAVKHEDAPAVRIRHAGTNDWSLAQQKQINVAAGQIFELSGFIRLEGEGNASLSVVLRDGQDKVIDWSFGAAETLATDGWRPLKSRWMVPAGATVMQVRLIGYRPATVWLADVKLISTGSIQAMRNRDLPAELSLKSDALEVTFHTADATLSVLDRKTLRTWTQQPAVPMLVLKAEPSTTGTHPAIETRLLDPSTLLEFPAKITLDKDREVCVTVQGEGELPKPLRYPHPFAAAQGDHLVMPVNEGISYPVDDQSLPEMHYILYGGHGLCMAWWGQCQGAQGVMTLVETPDDASVRVVRRDKLLCAAPLWESQKGVFGPARSLRFVFFDEGGYVAMCKRYRRHVTLKTLAQKREENPNVDKLIGAVNVWCWDQNAAQMCEQLRGAGVERILWSSGAKPEQIKKLNEMGVLTSRYDIYQDVMDPAQFPKLRGLHSDWSTAAWPNDLMIDAEGRWIRGWEVEAKTGPKIPCGVTCDRQAVKYAQERIPKELKTHPYQCRFIDTTTASPWRECYDPRHPVTRTKSREFKMRLLEVVSRDCKLVCGSETGHDAAVPYVHYFEGMLSLGPYRVPDSGNDMQKIWNDVPEDVAKFQTGHFYRLPLWELVYHDCVVAHWYWGDYNNKLPKLWDRRDLWNALYGTAPMFMFDRKSWEANRERFVQSYKATARTARVTGYREMLSHAWLTEDHAVQQTRFAGGTTVTVNFGDKPYRLADGETLAPGAQKVDMAAK